MKLIVICLIALLSMPLVAIDMSVDLSQSDQQAYFLAGLALAEFVQDAGFDWFGALWVTAVTGYLYQRSKGGNGSDQDFAAGVYGAVVDITVFRSLADGIAGLLGGE